MLIILFYVCIAHIPHHNAGSDDSHGGSRWLRTPRGQHLPYCHLHVDSAGTLGVACCCDAVAPAPGWFRLHYIGLHGHVHLSPGIHANKVSNPPKVLVRLLKGDGIHDDDEVIEIPELTFDGLEITSANEDQYDGDAWLLDRQLAKHDGVITQSVTLASEAALLGTPTLLISKAKRGFLGRLQDDGYPLFCWNKSCDGDAWKNKLAQFLAAVP